jgi:SUMO ligase MMS21 Smc5/6 complex component
MYRCITNITIEQKANNDYPNRKGVLFFDFVTDFECSDSWRDFTNKGKITLPKNLYFRDEAGKLQPLKGTNINVGGFSSGVPLFLRGDKVKIEAGYKYRNQKQIDITDISVFFEGYISKVGSKIPIELDIEDNMWILKQTAVETKSFSSSDTLEDILKYLVKDTSFTIRALTKTNFGSFTIGNETAAQVLQRLQKSYGFESYFRGNELRCGVLIYLPEEAREENFVFQKNIIDDELEYMRKDDVILSAIAHNTITESNGTTKDGKAKTKKKRLEVLVTIKNGQRVDTVIKEGESPPENIEGERRTFFFPGAKSIEELADLAYKELIIYYYTGLKGKFITFGIPFVRQGDNAVIKDPILPERDGKYKIKQVDYSGGVNGLRQEIHLDYKINL